MFFIHYSEQEAEESFTFPIKIKMVELISFFDGNYLPLAIFL